MLACTSRNQQRPSCTRYAPSCRNTRSRAWRRLLSPFVTCLCVTRNRLPWLLKAIEYYRAQTYRNKELLIVADGEDHSGQVPLSDDITYAWYPSKATIGRKRNIGCDRARGEIVCHWDDDDYSAPGRLSDQVSRLLSSGKAATGYYSMRFTDGRDWWLYTGRTTYALGTSLCYRRDWWRNNRFPPDQVGEDNEFVKAALRQRELVSVPAGDLMWASIHAGNTDPNRMARVNKDRSFKRL